jgi:hypothetical protein
MLLRSLMLCGCAVYVLIAPAAAQGPATSWSDGNVIGIALKTPGQTAKAAILRNFPGSAVSDVHAVFGTQQVKRDVVVGYFVNLTSQQQQQANDAMRRKMAAQSMGSSPLDQVLAQPGDLGEDIARIAINPNDGAHEVYAIEHYTEFPKAGRPVMATVEAALITKYGPPTRTIKFPQDAAHYYWFTNTALAKNQALVDLCLREGQNYNVTISNMGAVRAYNPGFDVTSTVFSNLVSYIGTKQYFMGKDVRKCGTILAVTVKPPRDASEYPHVDSIEQDLIDFNAGYSYVGAYAAKFQAEANGADQSKLKQDSKIKPTL